VENLYSGSCHCGAVRYRARLDLAAGTCCCNCRCCAKIRSWGALASDFELLQGGEVLGDYVKVRDDASIHHHFCTRCGVTVYGHGYVPEVGRAFVAVQLSTLGGASIKEPVSGAVRHSEGRNDNPREPRLTPRRRRSRSASAGGVGEKVGTAA